MEAAPVEHQSFYGKAFTKEFAAERMLKTAKIDDDDNKTKAYQILDMDAPSERQNEEEEEAEDMDQDDFALAMDASAGEIPDPSQQRSTLQMISKVHNAVDEAKIENARKISSQEAKIDEQQDELSNLKQQVQSMHDLMQKLANSMAEKDKQIEKMLAEAAVSAAMLAASNNNKGKGKAADGFNRSREASY